MFKEGHFMLQCKETVQVATTCTTLQSLTGKLQGRITTQGTIYSATTFLESCRKVVREKWFEKSGSRNLVREKWLTRKKGGFIS